MQRGQVPEGHRRPNRTARAGIGVSHYRSADITSGVKAFDDRSVVAQGTAMDVGTDAALGTEVPGHHLGGVVRRLTDLAEVWIRLVGRIAVVLVVGALASVVVLVNARPRKAVETLYRCGELGHRQGGVFGPLLERVGLDDHAGFQPLARNTLSWIESREDVTVSVPLVEHQPRRYVFSRPGPLAVFPAVHVMTGF